MNASRQRLRGFDENGIVQRDERLERSVRRHAPDCASLTARRVKGKHRGVWRDAAPEGVEPAPITVFAFARRVGILSAIERHTPEAVWLRRVNGWTTHLAAE